MMSHTKIIIAHGFVLDRANRATDTSPIIDASLSILALKRIS